MAREYEPSETVRGAREEAEQHRNSRPGEYRSAWQEQIRQVMDRILNRESFHYDLNGDALYQQYREQAVRNGRLAMMDTMGQASALTGGYGSSYTQSVGQQAYTQQLSTLNDRIPELYAMALERYELEGRGMQSQLDMLTGADDRDYGRHRDSVRDWQDEDDRLWNRYRDERDTDYDRYRDLVDDDHWQAEFDEARRQWEMEWNAAHVPVPDPEPVYYPVTTPQTPTKKEEEKKPKGGNPNPVIRV